jgi:hypothetical protein
MPLRSRTWRPRFGFSAAVSGDAIGSGIDGARSFAITVVALFVGWTVVPAVGALALGLWPRRILAM